MFHGCPGASEHSDHCGEVAPGGKIGIDRSAEPVTRLLTKLAVLGTGNTWEPCKRKLHHWTARPFFDRFTICHEPIRLFDCHLQVQMRVSRVVHGLL